MTKPKPTAVAIASARERKTAALAVKLTFVQRRVLGAVLDLFDGGNVAVTVSDVFTRLASDLSASPIAEAEIRRQLEGMPECVTRIRPEIVITDAAWASMRRQPAPVAAREPSTPIAEAVTAQPVPIAPPPVAPALRDPPKTPVRKPSSLSLDTVKVAERPRSDVTILAPAPEVDPEAVRRALAMEARPLPILSIHSEANEADVDRLVTQLADATANTDNAFQPVTIGPVFPRQDRETLTELALRYLRARGHEGATAAEAQADTGWDLGTTLCDITRRGRAVGVGNGSRHNGTHAIKDAPRRRWWAAEFAPDGLVAEAKIGKKAAPAVDTEQLADVQGLRQQIRDFDDAHANDVALMRGALRVRQKVTWGDLVVLARDLVDERDRLREQLNGNDETGKTGGDSGEVIDFTNEFNTLRAVLAPTEGQTLEDRARDLNTEIAAAKFWLKGTLTETVDHTAERVVKERDQLRADVNTSQDHIVKTWDDFAEALGFTGEARKLLDFARDLARDHADLSRAVDHTLHVLASNLPKDTPEIEGGDETTGPLSTGDELVALANAAANVLAGSTVDAIQKIREIVKADNDEDVVERVRIVVSNVGVMNKAADLDAQRALDKRLRDDATDVVRARNFLEGYLDGDRHKESLYSLVITAVERAELAANTKAEDAQHSLLSDHLNAALAGEFFDAEDWLTDVPSRKEIAKRWSHLLDRVRKRRPLEELLQNARDVLVRKHEQTLSAIDTLTSLDIK